MRTFFYIVQSMQQLTMAAVEHKQYWLTMKYIGYEYCTVSTYEKETHVHNCRENTIWLDDLHFLYAPHTQRQMKV